MTNIIYKSPLISSPFVEIPRDPQADWVTPEKQLVDLALPMARDLLYANGDRFRGLSDKLRDSLTSCAIRSIFKCSDLSTRNNESENRISSLMDLTVESILEPSPLPEALTTWYKALKSIDKLPEKIPPLSRPTIHYILNGRCPKRICSKMKMDGTSYTIGEKCALILVPQELENANELRETAKFTGNKIYPSNPLETKAYWEISGEEVRNTPFGPTYWGLHTDSVLESSRNQPYEIQAALVDSLARETFVDWQVPRYQDTVATIFLKKLGTGKILFQELHAQNRYIGTATRVKETVASLNYHWAVHTLIPSGIPQNMYCTFDCKEVGIGAFWKL